MIIHNVLLFNPDRTFQKGQLMLEHGTIAQVSCAARDTESARRTETEQTVQKQEICCLPDSDTGEEEWDAQGCYAIPGLIDLHFHGCVGVDVCDATREALTTIARYEAQQGICAMAPATMTLPVEELLHVLENAAAYAASPVPGGADLVGINMEGPFISRAKKGAQDASHIIPADVGIARSFLKASNGLVRFLGIAPDEHPSYEAFIRELRDEVHLSLAHTNATYEEAMRAFAAGANHAVHLYNAMPAFTHRAPGVVGAVFDSPQVDAEIICDGEHIHPSVVRSAFAMMGADRMILISDSMRATGMPDGVYTLGGQDVKVQGRRAALLADPGALAGSVTNLMGCLYTAVTQMQIPLENAVAAATINPARSLGIEKEYGSLEEGKRANVVLLRKDLSIAAVIKDGIRIR